ncbi:hypothetical protein IM157_01070 [Staphylococcus epidermidis]|nr:hypothetical protein [Staphylococcus epidermidis]
MELTILLILFMLMCIAYFTVPYILNKLLRTILGLVMCISLTVSVALSFAINCIEFILPMIIGLILIELLELKTDKYDINRKIKLIIKQERKALNDDELK